MELTLLVIYGSKVGDRCTACLGGRFILHMEGDTISKKKKKDRCIAYNKKGNGNNHRGTK